MPLNPYPSLRSQLLRLEALTPRVLRPDSSPRPLWGAGRRGPSPEAFAQGLHPADPSSSDGCPSQGDSLRTPCLSSAPCHPGPRPPSVSPPPTSLRQGPLPVLSGPAAPRAPRIPGIPLVSPAPGPLAPGRPRLADPRRFGLFRKPRTHRPPVTVPRATAGQPRGPPGLPPSESHANLPSQRELCRQEPGRPAASPDPAATRPTSPASGPRPPPPEHKARVSGPPPPPHLRPASPALTCRWPRTTPAPQTLPPPPVATKRHHLPHDNRPAPYHTSNLSIGWRGGGSLLRLVDSSCPSSYLYRPFSWTESSAPARTRTGLDHTLVVIG